MGEESRETQTAQQGIQTDLDPLAPLEGVIERVVFESAETQFFVGRLRPKGGGELQTFVGNLMAVSPGETVRLWGRWIDDKRFGRQFRAERYETVLPATVDGIEKYLGSGLIDGIGPKYAERLVKTFGVETLRVIDEQPQRLRRVPGIGPKRAAQIREAWQRQKAVQSIMIFLQGHGISAAMAVRIFKRYGDAAVAVLRENPYRLAEDVAGIAFKSADAIAAGLGISPDSPKRIAAGILHVLRRAAAEGHLFLPADELRERAAKLLDTGETAVNHALDGLRESGQAVIEGERVFLDELHRAESRCAELLKRLCATPGEPLGIQSVDNALRWVRRETGLDLSEGQEEAIRTALTAKTLVITGGPGTGKTTIIRSLLAILGRKNIQVELAAPTGRAAKRMEEAAGRPARTLHRLLEFNPRGGAFTRNETNPLATDLVIVDEASMLDINLFQSLLLALTPFTRLILVGDIDQLPSVGPGNVLMDIIASGRLPVVRLDTVFRQASESGIIRAAHQINAGRMPEFNAEDFVLVERRDPEKAVATLIELVAKRMPARFGLDPFRDIQVLAPLHRGPAGVTRLNEALQEALNPEGAPLPRRGFRLGDKVMQLRNNYELDVFNGDIGRIRVHDEETGEIEVQYDERAVLYEAAAIDDLGLAYASTIHKAQGSEYPAVVLMLLPQHYMMLQRNVVYTAVTRGRDRVVIVGDPKSVAAAAGNSRFTRRHTRFAERLSNRAEGAS